MAEDNATGSEEAINGQDIFYICKKSFETLRDKLTKGEEIAKELVQELANPENLKDEEIMVPVDMRGVGQEFDDVEEMITKLGAKGAIEAFVKAKEYFDANKDGEPDEERPKEMTAAEWKQVLADDAEGEEEDMLDEDEEEDLEDGEEEADDGEASEPAAKKAKTDG